MHAFDHIAAYYWHKYNSTPRDAWARNNFRQLSIHFTQISR